MISVERGNRPPPIPSNLMNREKALLIGFEQMVQDQPEKPAPSICCGKHPPHVGKAGPAQGDAPYVAGKPGEFVGCRTHRRAAVCALKTADIKNNAVRIGKSMHVGPVYDNFCGFRRDRVQALAAEKVGLFLDLFLLFFPWLLFDARTISPVSQGCFAIYRRWQFPGPCCLQYDECIISLKRPSENVNHYRLCCR